MKGVPILIEAFANLRDSHPDAKLILIGDGPERPVIEDRARDLELDNQVTFAGFRNQAEVADALGDADVFALPSFAEGVPVVLMEAMASRVPVVATRVAGVGELVEDGHSGLTVPPGDVASLARALDQLLRDPDLRASLGEAGRKKVCADYESSGQAKVLGSLFREVSGRGTR